MTPKEGQLLAMLRGVDATSVKKLERLILEALEYRKLRSAMKFLRAREVCIDSPDCRTTLEPEQLFELALMNGWTP